MRNDAYAANARPVSDESNNNLPAFAEYDHEPEKGLEQIPLNPPPQQAQYSVPNGAGGYGYDGGYAGYGDHWQQTSPTRPNQQLRFASLSDAGNGAPRTSQDGGMVGAPGAAGMGQGARLAAEARAQRGFATREDLRLLDPAAAAAPSADGGGTGPDAYHDYHHVEPFSGMYDKTAGPVGGYGYQDDDDNMSYAANPYYTQSQQQQDEAAFAQSPTRLAGPRAPSAGPGLGSSPTGAPGGGGGAAYSSYPPPPSAARQQEPPVLPYRESSTDAYGHPAGATPYYHDQYAPMQDQEQQPQLQDYHASDPTYGGHDRYQSQGNPSTDMYGAPARY